MSKYLKLLKQLNRSWKGTKPARGNVPDGTYQVNFAGAKIQQNLEQQKLKRGQKRQYVVTFMFKIVQGKQKKRNCFLRRDLLWEPESGDTGLARFMAECNDLGVKIKDLTPVKVAARLKKAIGTVLEITAKTSENGYQNVYIKRLIETAEEAGDVEEDEELEDEDLEDTEEDEEEEEDEDDDSDEEEDDEEETEDPDDDEEEDEEDEEDEDDDEEEIDLGDEDEDTPDDTEYEEEEEEESKPRHKKKSKKKGAKKKTTKKSKKKSSKKGRKKKSKRKGDEDIDDPSKWGDEFKE